MGYDVEQKVSDIYYMTGNLMFQVQIIVTGQMESDTHLSLKVFKDVMMSYSGVKNIRKGDLNFTLDID